jgi:DNA-directed RNA polymerase subunit RPC12/RpoP
LAVEGTEGTAPAPPPVPDDHALRHDSQATRTYPCGTCGSQLRFDIGEQRLKCPHCGNVQDLREVSGTVEERDLHSTIGQLRAQAQQAQALVAGEKEVVCQNCGGHTTFTGTLTATRCPYCVTPIQRDDIHDAPARLAVDGVLPFKVDTSQAEHALKEWVSSRWFAPSEFKDYSRAGSFESIYTAYFTFDAEAATTYRGQRGDDHTVTTGSGENRQTRTETRWRNVSGNVHNSFDDVAVAANDGLDEGHLQALEPWPMDQVQPFSPEFVAGHLSRTYDHDVEACHAIAQTRMEAEITRTIERDIGGDHQRISAKETSWSGLTFKHVLLPIWLLTVTYEGKPFQVMINGATGEVQGQRPYSKVKIAVAVVLALIVVAILVVLFRGG